MSKKNTSLIVRASDVKDLPFVVQAQLAELPEQAQQDFLYEYTRRKKEPAVAYVAHFATLSEGYLDNWTLQVLFWMSWFVLIGPLWWFINLFRMPGKVRKYNKKLAEKILKHIHFKYKISGKAGLASLKKGKLFDSPSKYLKKAEPAKPRVIRAIDPDSMTLESLKMGFLVDHKLETYEVVNDFQYDWSDMTSEKLYKLNELAGVDSFFLMLQREDGTLATFKVAPVNIYALKEDLEQEIQEFKRPSNIIRFQNKAFFREYSKAGSVFDMSKKTPEGYDVIVWKYFDENRKSVIRIEKHGEQAFKAFTGEIVSQIDFPNIMPKTS